MLSTDNLTPVKICLEYLSNELLLDLFEYFPTVHLLQAFYNLNLRLNNLIYYHFQTHTFNLQSISKYQFDLICQNYLPQITHRIRSLRLSDDDDTPQQLDLFFSSGLSLRQFSHLKSLTIYHLYSINSLKILIEQLSDLPNLTRLIITRHGFAYNELYDIGLIDLIKRLPKLIDCYLDVIDSGEYWCYPILSINSSSLKHLSLPSLDCNIHQLIDLIQNVPTLQTLNIRLVDHSIIPHVSSTKFLSIRKLNMTFFGCLNAMNNLLQMMTNLQEFKVEIEYSYINGIQWETLIETHLPDLMIFQMKMSTSLSSQKNQEEQIDEILNSFRSSFWIEKHRWFVQCNWNLTDNITSIVYIYTLPYSFANFFHRGNVQMKSTCSDNNQNWSFDRIHNLYYGHILSQDLSSSQFRLDNIRYLDLTIPFDRSIWSIVSTFDRLNSLNIVSSNKMDSNEIHSTIQRLIDQSSVLYSLNFFSWLIENKFPLTIKHLSIRQLNLQGPHAVYNQEQCLAFSQSVMGQQCQVLLINVQQRTDILVLVNHMINLRALNVKCITNVLIEDEEENLIEWLQRRLSKTCSIASFEELSSTVRLWIR